jgi:hypothetical protein
MHRGAWGDFVHRRAVLARDAEHWRHGFHLYLSVNLLCYDPGKYCINMYKFPCLSHATRVMTRNYIFPSIKSSCRCGVSAGSVSLWKQALKKASRRHSTKSQVATDHGLRGRLAWGLEKGCKAEPRGSDASRLRWVWLPRPQPLPRVRCGHLDTPIHTKKKGKEGDRELRCGAAA